MSAATDFAKLLTLSPAEALDYLAGRGDLTKTFSWQDLWQEEHAQQFTVSRLARLDLLQALRDSITQSVQGDLSRRDWMRDAEQLLTDAGWWGTKAVTDPVTDSIVFTKFDPARLKLIYDTNTRQAYSAGLWERMQGTKRKHPYGRYITKEDGKVRHHWHNVTLPLDDPFWSTHWPLNGYRCRCRVMSMSQRDFDKGKAPDGSPLNKIAPEVVMRDYLNPRTGEITQVPAGIDPGFAYNPGAARQSALQGLVDSKLRGASPDLSDAARKDGL